MNLKNRILICSKLVIALSGLLMTSVQADGDGGQSTPAPCFSSTANPDRKFNLPEVNGNYQYLGMFLAGSQDEDLIADFNTTDGNKDVCMEMVVTSNAETKMVTLTTKETGSLNIKLKSADSGKGNIMYSEETEGADAVFPVSSNGALVLSICAGGADSGLTASNLDFVNYYAKEGTSPQDAYNNINKTLVGLGMTNGYYIPGCKDGQPPKAES